MFSAHVKHLPNVKQVLNDLLMRHISPGGYLVVVTPNGSGDCRRRDSVAWDRKWGLKHPNFLDDEFYQRAFEGHRFLLTSQLGNLQAIREWAVTGAVAPVDLSGWELLAVVRR